MKYICNAYQAVLFDEPVSHREMSAGLEGEITGAGFVNIDRSHSYLRAYCYGESVSLKIKSNPDEDNRKVEKLLNGYND